jgi:DNA-directed RNA polymerase subunit RPC12/RpoP
MSRFDYTCPQCDASIGQISAGESKGFACPNCGEVLRVSPGPYKLVWILSILAAFCFSLMFRTQGWTFFFTTAAASIVIYIVGQVIASLVIPPKLERR